MKTWVIITVILCLLALWFTVMMTAYRIIFATIGILSAVAATMFVVKIVMPVVKWCSSPRRWWS